MKFKYLLINILIFFSLILNLQAKGDLKKVSIQLEWKHQFEFAGIYAAKQKGYYKDIGIDLEIKEYKNNINISDDVINGKSTFGISSSSLILEKLQKKPIILLSSYFKQNALALAVKPNIKTLNDLKGKKIMAVEWELEHTSLGAMLKDANINKDDINLIPHDFKVDKFASGEVDAMSIFITSQPYQLDKLGVKYNIINPAAQGVYSYDVELFTSEKTVINNPKMVEDFIKATNKGWKYAFKYKNEIVDLIYNKYTKRKTKEALLYEADKTEKLFKTHIFKIGAVVPELIKLNTDMYVKLGLVKKNFNVADLLSNYILKKSKKEFIFTQEELKYIKEHKFIKIAMLNNFKPFSFLEQNKHQGLSVDILKKISNISGLNFDIKTSSWSKALNNFKQKKVDMISGISHTKKREDFSLFTEPYYEISTYIFGLKSDKNYKNNISLKGKKVGVNKDMFYIDTLKKLGINVIQYPNNDQKAQALAFGEIDYYLSNYTTGLKAISAQSLTNIKPFDEFQNIKKEDLRYGIIKDNKILHSIIKKSLNYINKTDMYTLVNKWLLQIKENTNNLILTKKEKNWLKNNSMIRVAVMNYWNHDGSGNTIHTDYLKLLNKYSDLNIIPVRYDAWKEGYGEATSSNDIIHGIMNLAWSKEREEKYFLYTKAYIFEPSYLVVRENNTDIINLQDLKYKTVLSKEKSITDNIIKDISPDIKIVPIKSDNMMYEKIYNDKSIDAFITYKKDYKLLKKYNLKIVKTIYDKYSEASIGVRKKYPHLQSIINKIYKVMPKDELSNLQNKIYNDTKPYKVQPILKNKVNFTKKELAYLKNNPTIKVHNESNWAPYNYNINGKPYGFSIDYMNLLASKIGLNIKYINGFTWNQFLEKIKKNELDVMLNIAKTSKRDKYLNFTTSYINAVDTVFTQSDSKYKKLEDFNGKTMAVIRGFYEEELLRQYYPKIKILLVNNSLEGLKTVIFGKADGVINDFGSANFLIEKYNLSAIKPAFEANKNIFSLDLNLATNKSNILLRDILEKTKQFITQDEISNLKKKWIELDKNKLSLSLQQQQYLQNRKEIKFCADPNWLPFEQINNGELKGISLDYKRIFENKLNIPFKLIPTSSWSESIEFAKQRKCDILSFLAMETPKRKEYLNFTTPYVKIPLVLTTKLDVTFITDFKTLTTQKIGIPKEYAFVEILKNKYPNLNIVEVDNIKDGLEKVKNGELFGYIGTLASIGHMFQTHFTGELKIAGKFDETSKFGIAVRNDDKTLLGILQTVINNIEEDTHNAILNKHIAIKYEKNIDYEHLWQIIFIVFIILAGTIYWNRRLKSVNLQLKHTKKKLEGSLEDFEDLFNNTIEGIILTQNNICINANEAGLKLFKYDSKSDAIGENILNLVSPVSIDLVTNNIKKLATEDYEIYAIKKDGTIFPALVKGYNTTINNEPTRITSIVDITLLKQKENELIKAKDKALEATRIKSNFLSNMSHEIRTPMNAVIGMIHLIQQTTLDKKQKDYVSKIKSASNNLLNIINDILDFSKIEAGKLTLDKKDFNLKNILNEIENIVSVKINEKNLSFNITYEDNININLYGDSLRITQILINLISNAIKFTNKGIVELQIEQIQNDKFRFCISDTGIGLSEEQSKIIFSSFTQADDSITRKFGGTGLGLAICKQLVELMNGEIWIESEMGVGSKFIFEITLEQSNKVIKEKKHTITEPIPKTDTISIIKKEVSNKHINKLFDDLKIAVTKRRPNLSTPIIDELENCQLNTIDQKLFDEIKNLVRKYKFNEAKGILNDR